MTEKEKMLNGDLYMGSDPVLSSEHLSAVNLCRELNSVSPENVNRKLEILKKLCPNQGENVNISESFYCDYGYNIHLGNNVYINYNCTILDVNTVIIGND